MGFPGMSYFGKKKAIEALPQGNAAVPVEPPSSFASIEDASVTKDALVKVPVQPQGTEAATPTSNPVTLDSVLLAVQNLQDEVRTQRMSFDMVMKGQERFNKRTEDEHNHFAARFDILEHSLTNLQVQHADVAADLKRTQDSLAQLEAEYACASWTKREHMDEQQLEHDLIGFLDTNKLALIL